MTRASPASDRFPSIATSTFDNCFCEIRVSGKHQRFARAMALCCGRRVTAAPAFVSSVLSATNSTNSALFMAVPFLTMGSSR